MSISAIFVCNYNSFLILIYFFCLITSKTRALCAQSAESEIKRFLIGTQSLKYSNQVHLIEYDDETNTIEKCIYDHKEGEVWHIAASPTNKSQFITCYDKCKQFLA